MTALPPPRAILFDWDNTLVDNWPVIAAALNAAQMAMGQAAWSEVEVRARVRRSVRETFPEMFGARAADAERIFYAAFAASHLAGLGPMAGAVAALDAAAARGIPLGVVSNKHGSFLRTEAAHLGWSDRFGRIVGATDTPADKPAADPVVAALAGTGIDPGPSVWFVGDAGIDMECAIRSGCVPVLVRNEETLGSEFERWKPRLHLPDCLALAALF